MESEIGGSRFSDCSVAHQVDFSQGVWNRLVLLNERDCYGFGGSGGCLSQCICLGSDDWLFR